MKTNIQNSGQLHAILELEKHKLIQSYIIKSDGYRCEINKAINNKESIEDILLKALECIAFLTDDKVFYNANKSNLQAYDKQS